MCCSFYAFIPITNQRLEPHPDEVSAGHYVGSCRLGEHWIPCSICDHSSRCWWSYESSLRLDNVGGMTYSCITPQWRHHHSCGIRKARYLPPVSAVIVMGYVPRPEADWCVERQLTVYFIQRYRCIFLFWFPWNFVSRWYYPRRECRWQCKWCVEPSWQTCTLRFPSNACLVQTVTDMIDKLLSIEHWHHQICCISTKYVCSSYCDSSRILIPHLYF